MKNAFFLTLFLFFPIALWAQPIPISDILNQSADKEIVTLQGRITLFEDEDKIYVQDPTAKISVELKEEHEKMGLKKGDEIEITGKVDLNYFTNSKKIEAMDITVLK